MIGAVGAKKNRPARKKRKSDITGVQKQRCDKRPFGSKGGKKRGIAERPGGGEG